MPKKFDTDIVETSLTLGTGTYTVEGARAGYRSFDEAFGSGDTPYYVVRNSLDTKYEHNMYGTYSSGVDTLTRNVYLSSNGNAPVNWVAEDLPLLVYIPPATEIFDDISRGFKAPTRSPFLTSGLWIKEDHPDVGVDTVMYYDGSVDVPILEVNSGSAALTVEETVAEIHKWLDPDNGANKKRWRSYLNTDGDLVYGAQTDDEGSEVTLKFKRDGSVEVTTPGAADDSKKTATTEWIRDLLEAVGPKTGDLRPTHRTTAYTGWILWADGTIGNAASGATVRANADTAALYAVYWDGYSDATCPVTGGRGANAAADFAAGKPLQIPRGPGRALGVAGTGAGGLTARALGSLAGAETHVHNGTSGGPSSGVGRGDQGGGITVADMNHTHFMTTDASSSMQPTTFANVMIKL